MEKQDKLEFEDKTLLIGIPSQSEWAAEFGLSLALMVHHLTYHLVKFHIQNERGSILPQLRQNLVDFAIANKATHLLFLDSDQTFPEELAVSWLRADRPVIAANIATKSMPSWPTAKVMRGGEVVPHYSDLASERYSKVGRVGTGIMMLKLEVLEQLPRPAFLPGWHDGVGQYIGEDWTMVGHLEQLGIPVVVDNQASQVVGHVGKMTYTQEHLIASRKAQAANESKRDHKPRIITPGQA